jgi:acetoin utilization deacetylase AcuC-like enzyme
MVKVAYSERYIYELPEGHRFPIAKYKRIVDKLLEDNIIDPQQIFDPGMVDNEVLLAHDIEYYNKVIQLALGADEIRTLGVPLHEASVNRALNSVAGTVRSAESAAKQALIYERAGIEFKKSDRESMAHPDSKAHPESKTDSELKVDPGLKAGPGSKLDADLKAESLRNSEQEMNSKADMNLKTGLKAEMEVKKTGAQIYNSDLEANRTRLGISIGGGYHHAFYDHGEGFCIFNDLAIAARYLINKGLAKRILILDLDVHQGNGTASILNKDENIFTFSMHGSKNYPAKKQTSDYDLDLPDGTGDRDYLYNLEFALDAILQQFIPDYMLYQGGVDVLQSDQLGRLGLTMLGCKKRDNLVVVILRTLM